MRGSLALLLAAAVAMGAASAYADVITVTPENLQGWSFATANDGIARLSKSGPITGETLAPHFQHGDGAYYAECTFAPTPPANAWFGTDEFNGRPLAGLEIGRITKMQYYSWSSAFPVVVGGGNVWKYVKQPITLQLTFTDGVSYRTAMFRPWSKQGQPPEGDNSITQKATWQFHDCMAEDVNWYIFENDVYLPWSGIRNQYGNWTLVPTSTTYDPENGQYMSCGWPNSTPAGQTFSTGTGKCLNFEVGARKQSEKIFMNPLTLIQWYKESAGFRGYVDWFTFGMDYGDETTPDVVENTYDFEPSATEPTPRVVALQTFDAAEWTALIDRTFSYNTFVWKVFGLVTAINVDTVNPGIFEITDSAGRTQLVRAIDNDVAVGDYISATGQLRKLVWGAEPKPAYLWTTKDSIVKYCQF